MRAGAQSSGREQGSPSRGARSGQRLQLGGSSSSFRGRVEPQHAPRVISGRLDTESPGTGQTSCHASASSSLTHAPLLHASRKGTPQRIPSHRAAPSHLAPGASSFEQESTTVGSVSVLGGAPARVASAPPVPAGPLPPPVVLAPEALSPPAATLPAVPTSGGAPPGCDWSRSPAPSCLVRPQLAEMASAKASKSAETGRPLRTFTSLTLEPMGGGQHGALTPKKQEPPDSSSGGS
jgi:hypothetical protein